ncbi:histone-lysine N-methyltransferase PRDM9-like [Haliotis asinina]|uniref:histone-lysine N-methyltransferase PRDM9-like n=1 Tax=Haliotis asinina TaxID=109174 RepID=UPI0035325987
MAEQILQAVQDVNNVGSLAEVQAAVTDFPAVEVEVHDKAIQDIGGLQTLTAVLTEAENSGMETDALLPNNIVKDVTQGHSHRELEGQEGVDPKMQILISNEGRENTAVYLVDYNYSDKDIKDQIVPGMNDSRTINVSLKSEEEKSLSTQEHQPSGSSAECGSPVECESSAEGSAKTLSPQQEDSRQTNLLVSGTGKVESHNTQSQQELLQHVELRGKDTAVTRSGKKASRSPQWNLLWCQDCGKSNIGHCRKHGSLITVPDSHVPTYARLTLPSVLVIKVGSKGEGVFAKKYIKARTQFGPLKAPFCTDTSKSDKGQTDFYLKGYDSNDDMLLYDLSSEAECNWMMFVQPAQTYTDQNMAAYVYDRKVYYTTIKPIEYGKELKVWYAADYAVKIGMSLFTDVKQETGTDKQKQGKQHKGDDDMTTPPELEVDVVDNTDDEFQVAENEDGNSSSDSCSGTHCISCDTQFKTKSQLFSHSCTPRKTSSRRKRGSGSTRRKGSPRKLALDDDDDDDVDDDDEEFEVEVKAKKSKKKAGRKSQDQSKGKTKRKRRENSEKKKYARTPKFSCSYCPEQFAAEDFFRAHEASHTGKSAYTCDEPNCGKGFVTKFTHWRHMLSHRKPMNRQCPYCDKAFNRMDHLKTHLKTHDQHRFSYLCDKCGKSYLHKNTYDYHMALHEAKEGVSLVCMICSAKCENKEDLIKHTLTHNRYKSLVDTPKKHACSVCNRMFGTNKDVKRHMVVHTKEKCFLCELCPQTFGRKDHLHRHYKTNHCKETKKEKAVEGEQVFRCQHCPEIFPKKKLLTNHVRYTHEQTMRQQFPEGDEHPLAQAAGDITEAAVTSSSYNLYTLSTPQLNTNNPVAVAPNQAAKALERYINTNVTTSNTVITPQTVMEVCAPVTFINGQTNMPVTVMPQGRECPDQLQQVKDRPVFQQDQMAAQRQTRPMPWSFTVIEERDDHSYSTAPAPAWTPKVPNFRQGGTSVAEVETARLLQSAQTSHGSFSGQCNNATTMAVAWDTMTEYFAVQPCNNITEVVTSNSIVQQTQAQQITQNMPHIPRGHLQQGHAHHQAQ